jgi:hypothetical protein
MYARCVKRWRTLQESLRGGTLAGLQIPYQQKFEELFARPSWEPGGALSGLRSWARLLGRFGFPYTTLPQRVKVLTRAFVDGMSDAELLEILSSAALLDAGAAVAAAERGMGELLGVRAILGETIPAVEELILPAAGISATHGKLMYNFAYAPSGSEAAQYARIELTGAEALTLYRGPNQQVLHPGLTRFVNARGGRVAVLGCSSANASSNLFNHRRKAIFMELFEWLNGEPIDITVVEAPNAWCLVNKNAERLIVMLANLSPDEIILPKFKVAPRWQTSNVEELDENGNWQMCESHWKEATLQLSGTAHYLKPRLFRLT